MTPEEITDYKLLNIIDRIKETVLDATSLDESITVQLLDAAEGLKEEISAGSSTWEGTLFDALQKSMVITQGRVDKEENAVLFLQILENPARAETLVDEFEYKKKNKP